LNSIKFESNAAVNVAAARNDAASRLVRAPPLTRSGGGAAVSGRQAAGGSLASGYGAGGFCAAAFTGR